MLSCLGFAWLGSDDDDDDEGPRISANDDDVGGRKVVLELSLSADAESGLGRSFSLRGFPQNPPSVSCLC